MSQLMILKPRLSEKAYSTSQTLKTYVFTVPSDAGKQAVAEAVASQFEVAVINVNTTNVKGKSKRSVRKNGKSFFGKRVNFKKAYVTIGADQTIPIFAAEEAEDAKQAKARAKDTKKEKK